MSPFAKVTAQTGRHTDTIKYYLLVVISENFHSIVNTKQNLFVKTFTDAVFGWALEDQFSPTGATAPPVLVKCVQELEDRATQMGESLRKRDSASGDTFFICWITLHYIK